MKLKNIQDPQEVQSVISEKLVDIYNSGDEQISELNIQDGRLNVILLVGVNGVGKTTTIGKLAHKLKNEGKSVVLAAGDTFRAGAIEQLEVWGERTGVPVIKQAAGSDPAAVIYDAVHAAKARGADVLICDTAGRLQNKVNLMKELEKVKRVIEREVPELRMRFSSRLTRRQVRMRWRRRKNSPKATNVTGIALTKLDGTAKAVSSWRSAMSFTSP